MSLNSLYLKIVGLWGHKNAGADDAKQLANRPYTVTVDMTRVGAIQKYIYLGEALANITVTRLRTVPSIAVTSATSDPEFDLVYGDVAAGAVTTVGEFVDVSATALVARTAVDNSLSTAVDVPKGNGLYLFVDVNGTPADMGEDGHLTFQVDWEYTG